MTFSDSFLLAYRVVSGNKLRSGITIAIIAFGIMALIGIITAIEAMNQSLRESFSSMGANAINIRFKESKIFGGHRESSSLQKKGKLEKKGNLGLPIQKRDAEYFKKAYNFPAITSIYIKGGGGFECHFENKKTTPQNAIWGGDENYLTVTGYNIVAGRNFSNLEVGEGSNVCLLGSNTAMRLFGDRTVEGVGKEIKVGNWPYRVIGILKSKGSSPFLRQDDVVVTTYNNAYQLPTASVSFIIGIMVRTVKGLEGAESEAVSLFRSVRKLHPIDEDNFVIEKSDKFAELFITFLGSIAGSAGAIGMITLIGAAIGLMNIMLVAVSERTKEVGLVKAIGGKRRHIRNQFLFESVIISLLGAFFGIVLGVLVGNIFGLLLHTGFIVPWGWVLAGIAICSGVGLTAGIYPALKAAKLNPIAALRYE